MIARFLVATFLLGTAIGARAEDGVERPTWSIGDTWTYLQTVGPATFEPATWHYKKTYTVIELRPTSYRGAWATTPMEQTTGESASTVLANISRDLNGYYRASAKLPYSELSFLQWPLVGAKSWSFVHPMADGRLFDWQARVEGWEDVTVPAGTFRAIVIKIDGQARGGDSYAQHRTIWFAPATKSKVKEAWFATWNLYTLNKEVWELESFALDRKLN